MRYSGLALQLLLTLFVLGWIGYRLDLWLHFRFPVFMLTLGLLGFAGVLYKLYNQLKNEK